MNYSFVRARPIAEAVAGGKAGLALLIIGVGFAVPLQALGQAGSPQTTPTIGGGDAAAQGASPLVANSKWTAFGPIAYFVNRALYDASEEDLIVIGVDGEELRISSPESSADMLLTRTRLVKNFRGKPILVPYYLGSPITRIGGSLSREGSIEYAWYDSDKFESRDVMSLTTSGCLQWDHTLRSNTIPEKLKQRTFCPIAKNEVGAAAARHFARVKSKGQDVTTQKRDLTAAIDKAEQEAAERERLEERMRAERQSSGGGNGWLGGAIGAVVGAAVGSSHGGNTEAIASAALAGAQAGNPNSALLASAGSTFQNELAQGAVQRAQSDAFVDKVRAEAATVEREREQQREVQERERLRQQQNVASAVVDRERLASQQQKAAQTEATRQASARSEEQARLQNERQRVADQQAEAERRRVAEEERVLALRQAEQSLRSGFSGRATTCVGGGKDVLYLQSSRPGKSGCNVSFEARCPGTPSGAGIKFSQANYIGASCIGLGDIIRIGTMSCAADAVRIEMVSADCGSGG
ncbi:hypothetical protein [Stenotrophomonas sp.]|uniref:hypothetical protein n=1 Tax=Stenotrophomonas sp. TaxID=69392 RepID=UPI0028AA3233|nr:hypothetical protein [Stenotrophomonas sp.]